MNQQNNKEINNKDFFKGVPTLILIIVVIYATVWFYNYSNTKSECQQQVRYNPGTLAKIYGQFSWNNKSFESRDEAVKYCIRASK